MSMLMLAAEPRSRIVAAKVRTTTNYSLGTPLSIISHPLRAGKGQSGDGQTENHAVPGRYDIFLQECQVATYCEANMR